MIFRKDLGLLDGIRFVPKQAAEGIPNAPDLRVQVQCFHCPSRRAAIMQCEVSYKVVVPRRVTE